MSLNPCFEGKIKRYCGFLSRWGSPKYRCKITRNSALTHLCSKTYKTILASKTNIQKSKNIDPTFVFETHVNICDSERKNVYSWFVFALLARIEPLPGFTNQRPIGKPICLRRTPEPTGCFCSRKDTYVHFFSHGEKHSCGEFEEKNQQDTCFW